MRNPLLSIIIPTHNRPHLVGRALKTALEQTVEDLEVIIVDDGSTQPLNLPEHPRLRLIRLSKSQGGAAARNVGTNAACGRWVTYLDDDDRLLPHMVATSLKALSNATLPEPIAVISGVEVVNPQGQVIVTRLPPPVRPRGNHFSLEEIEPRYSYNTKQTLVVEREVLHQINGWDEKFRSRVHSELLLRLNPVCSILGLPVTTYQLTAHDGVRVSGDLTLRQESFQRLVRKHESIFKAHPKMFASFVYKHALKSYELGQRRAALLSLCWAMQIAPFSTFTQFAPQFYQSLLKKLLVE